MNMEERLARIEARLAAIEQSVAAGKETAATGNASSPSIPSPPLTGISKDSSPPWAKPANKAIAQKNNPAPHPASLPVTNILGWAGATALVLAAIYLVSLAIDAGWLTPPRQVLLAMLSGFACIGVGLLLRGKEMHYASLLPAAGIVVLFLSVYGAHNYHHLISTALATSGVIGICLISLWLNRMFLSELYALFAVVGSYSAPIFLGGIVTSIMDLVVYFACWSVVFSIFAIWVRQRSVYILAMYLAFVIFDLEWRQHVLFLDAWIDALIFQTVHFSIFVVAAMLFSIRIAPMSKDIALAHLPPLVLFYFVQYSILDAHLAGFAPWVAVGSAALLLGCYFIAHRLLGKELEGGRMLLSSYVALVLVHAGYIESVPAHWAPWVGLLLIPMVAAYAALRGDAKAPGLPMWIAVALLFFSNYLSLLAGYAWKEDGNVVPAHDLLALCYAIELYLGYYFLRKNEEIQGMGIVALYAAHVAAMAWAIQFFDNRFFVSLAWGVLAVGCLLLALKHRDKILGQSSLFIFAASVCKAMLYDIALASPLIRIASLIALGVSLYLGGWLYKKVSNIESS